MAERVLLRLAADPPTDVRGGIGNIVNSAHKWGGDGAKPSFDKIKRVLMTKHPEVIAKAFGGDPNKAAGWIKARWYQLKGLPVPGHSSKGGAVHAALVDPDVLELAFFPISTRKKLAAKGHAMPDGSFPIRNTSDLKNAIKAHGRAKNKAAAKRHIIKRAHALGAHHMLPDEWKKRKQTVSAGSGDTGYGYGG